jgi:DNA-binding NarL/FixJ family response regulator
MSTSSCAFSEHRMTDESPFAQRSKEVVLVVDDSPATLSLLTDTLETIGVTVLVSPSGEHAIKLIDKVTPDVVLMDAVMPGLDGFETCRRLKTRRDFKHVPVIFMTGLSATEHIVKALEAGGVDYLTKPVSPDEMIARMQVHLANARVTRSAQVALDKSRRFLLATDFHGQVIWSTPEAGRMLDTHIEGLSESSNRLAAGVCRWLQKKIGDQNGQEGFDHVIRTDEGIKLAINYLGEASRGEYVIRIVEQNPEKDKQALMTAYGLTPREAEVAVWLSQGKSNREIGEILQLSPRTVNKHLETVFGKIGVDNRTSAATAIVKALAAPSFDTRPQ